MIRQVYLSIIFGTIKNKKINTKVEPRLIPQEITPKIYCSYKKSFLPNNYSNSIQFFHSIKTHFMKFQVDRQSAQRINEHRDEDIKRTSKHIRLVLFQ